MRRCGLGTRDSWGWGWRREAAPARSLCGAGGCTKGYQRAGFYVVGVDIEPQPNYCGDDFLQMEALAVLETLTLYAVDDAVGYDAIHASPTVPRLRERDEWRGDQGNHPELIQPVRELLEAAGLPYVIENVVTPEIRSDFMLCGSMFGLPIRRHRFFETNWSGLTLQQPCRHRSSDLAFMHKGERAYADAMGCGWMTAREGRDAIPRPTPN